MMAPTKSTSSSSKSASGRAADGDLFQNLVEIVPLVERLMDRRANPSFGRRASMAYTAAPSQRSKVGDAKAKRTQSAIKETNKHIHSHESVVENIDMFSSRAFSEDEKEELTSLREQLDDLRIKVSEKEEALKLTEDSLNQMTTAHSTIHELKHKLLEKELVLKSVNSQLSNAEIKLAEKQEVLDKLESEKRISNKKMDELQRDLDNMDFEKSALILLFEELSRADSSEYSEENITCFQQFDHLHIDDLTELDMEEMDEARMNYMEAIAHAKKMPSDESLAAAAKARLKLQSYAF